MLLHSDVLLAMEESSPFKAKPLVKKETKNMGGCEDGEGESEEGDIEAWDTLSKGFKQVRAVLDQNSVLINQVNGNHMLKIPDNLAKKARLIREIHGNISEVPRTYSDLSINFTDIVCRRRMVGSRNVDTGNVA